MQAVMNVIANRAGGDYRRFVAVALRPKQFSMFNRATSKTPTQTVDQVVDLYRRHPRWQQAQMLVRQAAAGTLADVTGRANHYHAQSVSPSWANPKHRTAQIGNHLFYRESLADRLLRDLI